jgi:hypothetical protein
LPPIPSVPSNEGYREVLTLGLVDQMGSIEGDVLGSDRGADAVSVANSHAEDESNMVLLFTLSVKKKHHQTRIASNQ